MTEENEKITYSNQGKLPQLPLPDLASTLSKYIETVKPLLTTSQLEQTIQETKSFESTTGAKLQTLLEEYNKSQNSLKKNYLEDFWNEAYLSPDTSVVLNVNPFFLLENDPDPSNKSQHSQLLNRAASLTFATCKFISLLKQERLSPDTFRHTPLCMDQFKSLFASCRIPCSHADDYVQVYPDSNHVLVLCRNQMYYIQVLNGEYVATTEQELKSLLQAILEDATSEDLTSSTALGVLTTLSRHDWAKARNDLLSCSSRNKTNMSIVDSALFCLVLDDTVTPLTIQESAANALHGTYKLSKDSSKQLGSCCNRWYDKLQILICNDGSAGVNFEHSSIDGHTALRVASDIYADTVIAFARTITKSIYVDLDSVCPSVLNATLVPSIVKTQPKKLSFDIPPTLFKRIYFAETALGDQILSCDVEVLQFQSFGKRHVTKHKCSPDAFCQLAILLAYYRLYGKIVCVYESVLTKNFHHGRTEAMRTATLEALQFCKTFCDEYATPIEKLDKFRQALQRHVHGVKECSKGLGVDRHLFALKCIAERHSISTTFFQSKAFGILNHAILSTSNCGNPSLRLFGFGPVVQDGFGIGYIIRDFDLQFNISSNHRQTKRFCHALRLTLEELGVLINESNDDIQVVSKSLPPKKIMDSFSERDALDSYEIFGEGSDIQLVDKSKKEQDKSSLVRDMQFVGSVKRMHSVSQKILESAGEGLGGK